VYLLRIFANLKFDNAVMVATEVFVPATLFVSTVLLPFLLYIDSICVLSAITHHFEATPTSSRSNAYGVVNTRIRYSYPHSQTIHLALSFAMRQDSEGPAGPLEAEIVIHIIHIPGRTNFSYLSWAGE
jgi:hypothetical protein